MSEIPMNYTDINIGESTEFSKIQYNFPVRFVGNANYLLLEECSFNSSVIFEVNVKTYIKFKKCNSRVSTVFYKNVASTLIIEDSFFIGQSGLISNNFKDLIIQKNRFECFLNVSHLSGLNLLSIEKNRFSKNLICSNIEVLKILTIKKNYFGAGLSLVPLDCDYIYFKGNRGLNNFKSFSKRFTDNNPFDLTLNLTKIITGKQQEETFRLIRKLKKDDDDELELRKLKAIELEGKRTHINPRKIWSETWFYTRRRIGMGYEPTRHLATGIPMMLKNWKEFFRLTLNFYSSNHGLSWYRGILFTFSITIFFHTLCIITLENGLKSIYLNDFVKGIFIFILPNHELNYLNVNEVLNVWFYVSDFIGRILVSYGVFQTVQAFRIYK